MACTIGAARSRRHAAVGGVHQGSAWGNIDLDGERAVENLATLADHGRVEPLVGKDRSGVRLARRRIVGPAPRAAAVGGTCPGGAAHGLGVLLAGDEFSVTVAQVDGASVAVELEGGLLGADVVGA